MDYKDYSKTVKHFKQVYPFADRDWKYTRNLGTLKFIRYDDDSEKLWSRIKHTSGMFFFEPSWAKEITRNKGIKSYFLHKYYTLVIGLKRRKHLPDGVVEGMGITHWEEAGEYAQLVSPAVGDILVEWLENDSENPYAIKVVEKMREILDDYWARVKAEWPDA